MAIQTDGLAPYAPPQAVLAVLDFDRKRGLPTPVTVETVERVGVSAALAPRTAQALKVLDLIDEDGSPTPAMLGLRKASTEEYQQRLTEVLETAYGEVFRYVDPREDDVERVRDAFRHFTPVGMQDRMVTLFLGLCATAGIIDEAPRGRGRPPKIQGQSKATNTARSRRKATKTVDAIVTEQPPEFRPSPPPSSGQHPFIEGLLQSLPDVGSVWPDAKRKDWTDAATAVFNMIYERPPEDSVPKIDLEPSGREG